MTLPASPTIATLHDLYAGGLTPAAAIAALYRRIAAIDDPGIFITLVAESDAVKAAEALGAFDPVAKPLWGIPFAVKDNIDVAGLPTTAACPAFAHTPDETAFAVQRLIEAGVSDESLARIRGPIGLDIGADTPEEMAVSIMSEIIAVRHQREGGPLTRATGNIRGERTAG